MNVLSVSLRQAFWNAVIDGTTENMNMYSTPVVGVMACAPDLCAHPSNNLHLFICIKQPESPKPVKLQASLYAFLYTMFMCMLH